MLETTKEIDLVDVLENILNGLTFEEKLSFSESPQGEYYRRYLNPRNDHSLNRPSRPDKARRLGYKARQALTFQNDNLQPKHKFVIVLNSNPQTDKMPTLPGVLEENPSAEDMSKSVFARKRQ